MNLLFSNPILKREIEHRMRDKRTYFIPTVYLALLGLAAASVYLISGVKNTVSGATTTAAAVGPEVGNSIFVITVVLQMVLVVMLVPSLSGAAITAERDRGCLIPVLVTPMSRAALTIGKLLAPILYIFFLLFISLPFAALSFGFGGTDLSMLLSAFGLIAASALFFASIGLFISTLFLRTTPAVIRYRRCHCRNLYSRKLFFPFPPQSLLRADLIDERGKLRRRPTGYLVDNADCAFCFRSGVSIFSRLEN
jgi:ABC-type transport system involved in multi-copper enzyme maturation permease subunit